MSSIFFHHFVRCLILSSVFKRYKVVPPSIPPHCPSFSDLQGKLLKMIVEAIKDLVNDGNLECTRDGITLQVSRKIVKVGEGGGLGSLSPPFDL